MTTEFLRDAQEPPASFKFAARKVRLGREFYVEATAPDRKTYRIGSFKFRGRAQDWIKAHAATWRPDQTNLNFPSERKAPHMTNTANAS